MRSDESPSELTFDDGLDEIEETDSFLLAAARIHEVAPPALGAPGRWIAGRYRLDAPLGRGGHGEVWEADDRLSGERVAVKLLRPGAGALAARACREAAALRVLRLPGVVRLIDEGVDEGQPFLTMERVDGAPFPGFSAPCSWAALEGPLALLLEALARVHAVGIVHRDLKPGNVLVDAAGRPTILDFGLSAFATPANDRITDAGTVLGTPAYLAPEQAQGGPITARADLYAVGVMAYAALAGRLPHEGATFGALLSARLTQRPPPLKDLAPDVPGPVAAIVDQLLAIDPEARPRSAAEALERLRGQRAAAAPRLPRLEQESAWSASPSGAQAPGCADPVAELLHAASRGLSVDLLGPPGSGKSRCLDDLEAALEEAGRRVFRAVPAGAPFASLEPLVGTLAEHGAARLQEITARVERALSDALQRGAVLLADDADRIDHASAGVIARCLGEGAAVRAFALAPGHSSSPRGVADPPALILGPIPERSLRALFVGPDRLLHLREDAARALAARTGGLPARVAREIDAWTRAGLARWHGAWINIDRDAIDRLATGQRLAAPRPPARAPLSPRLAERLAWIALAGTEATVGQLAAAMGEAPWRLEADLAELQERGLVCALPSGHVAPDPEADAEGAWSLERRRSACAALAAALPAGTPGRLEHLLAAGPDVDPAEIAREAVAVASRVAAAGQLGRAVVPLGEGLRALRRRAPVPAEELSAIFALWVEIALADGAPQALDRVLYELCRPGPRAPLTARLEQLVRAALAVDAWTARAAELAEAVPPFESPRLERLRHGVRALAARRDSLAREEEILGEAARWAAASGDRAAAASVAAWLGRLRYCQNRFEEAARLEDEAAGQDAWLTVRISARLDGASAWMEVFALDDAAARAEEGLALARRCRLPALEARAEWLLRCIAYRAGRTDGGGPDEELVEAAARLGAPHLEGLICVGEAAIAYRGGERDAARALAGRAHRIWSGTGHPLGSLLAGGLLVAAGGALGPGEIERLAAQARGCAVPSVGLQVLALLAERGVSVEAAPEALRAMAGQGAPRTRWDQRLDVLSIAEALARLGVPA